MCRWIVGALLNDAWPTQTCHWLVVSACTCTLCISDVFSVSEQECMKCVRATTCIPTCIYKQRKDTVNVHTVWIFKVCPVQHHVHAWCCRCNYVHVSLY